MALIIAFLVWRRRADGPSPTVRPDVLLITIDTLRADHLGCYGAPGAATPSIDALAASGVLFESAACPMPLTRPSHFSLMTALYPRDHGVLNNQMVLPDGVLTVAEVFAQNGYETAAFVAVRLLGPDSGAAQGFQHFDGPSPAETAFSADQVVGRARPWIASARGPGDRPRFLWVHLFDPHMPYVPHTTGASPASTDEIAQDLPEVSWPRLLALGERHQGRLPREVLTRAAELYRGEVAFTDRWVGELIGAFDRQARGGPAVVALTADHGECFDHGIFFEHSDCLYDGAVRVPMILRGADARVGRGRRVPGQVENLDLAPTLMELAGIPRPPAFAGRSLLAAEAEDKASPRAAFVQHPRYALESVQNRLKRQDQIVSVGDEPVRPLRNGQDEAGVRTVRWKYITGGAEDELYDLAADPGEARNLARQQPDVGRRLRQDLDRWRTEHPLRTVPAPALSEDEKATLRALGYLQ